MELSEGAAEPVKLSLCASNAKHLRCHCVSVIATMTHLPPFDKLS